MDVRTVADELYGLDPAEFTATRDARAKQARAEGDAALAREIRALRRPSLPAWAVNQLVRHRPGELDRLVELGAALRDATEQLDPDQLRQLGRQRRQLVATVAEEARRLAADRGSALSSAGWQEMQETLEAALIDPAVAEEVRSGRLTKALAVVGLGGDLVGTGPRGQGRATRATARPPSAGQGSASPSAGAEQAERAAKAATADAEAADITRAHEAEEAERAAKAAVAEAEAAAITRAHEAEEAERAAKAAVAEAEAAAQRAHRAHDASHERRQSLEAELAAARTAETDAAQAAHEVEQRLAAARADLDAAIRARAALP